MPCTRPPCTCPLTISGLMMLPMSSTQTYLRIVGRPVSVSTSIAHRWVPCGKEKLTGSYVASASMPGLDALRVVVRRERRQRDIGDRRALVGALDR